MFREMRLKNQQLSEEEAIEILKNGKTGILGVNGDDGYPYTVPVNYVYADGKIYIHGAKSGHKQDAIAKSDKVSFCVVARDDVVVEELTTWFQSVIVFGRAKRLETDEEKFHAVEVFGLKYCPDKEAVDKEIRREWQGLSCFEISIEHITGKEAGALAQRRKKQA